MTESEWLAAKQEWELKRCLETQEGLSDRKWRLFACASVRRLSGMITKPLSWEALRMAELYADGQIQRAEAEVVKEAAARETWPNRQACAPYTADFVASQSVVAEEGRDCRWFTSWASGMAWQVIMAATGGYSESKYAEWSEHECSIIRDIFGNPFRPVTIDPAWLTGTVQHLALSACNERELPSGHLEGHRLAVLADALEEAGCQDAELLGHLRSEQVHVRGCWALDLLLSRK